MEKNYGMTSGTGLDKSYSGTNKMLIVVICILTSMLLVVIIGAYCYFVHPYVKYFCLSPKVYHGVEHCEAGVISRKENADAGKFLDAYEFYGFSKYDIVDFYYVDNSHRSGRFTGEVSSFYVFDLDVGDSRQELIDYITTIGVSCGNLDFPYHEPDIELYILPGDQFSLRDNFLCAFSREGGYVRYMLMTESMNVFAIENIPYNLLWDSTLTWEAIG